MPKENYLYPIQSGEDPNTIDYYIKRLMDCSDALVVINERRECFLNAQYEAKTKEMLCIYMLMDAIAEMITTMRKENKCFRNTTNEGMRAIMELLPDYVAAENNERLTG